MTEAGAPDQMPEASTSPEGPQYVCAYHPDRRAQGVCMSCRQVICSECSTKIDGINHCLPCLEKKAAGTRRREHPILQHLVALTWSAVLFLGVAALIYHLGTVG
jgi:hypothetical protein